MIARSVNFADTTTSPGPARYNPSGGPATTKAAASSPPRVVSIAIDTSACLSGPSAVVYEAGPTGFG